MKRVLNSDVVLERQLVKRVPIPGGYRTEDDGPKTQANIEIEIDVEKLALSHGIRAMIAKRGFSTLADGAIRVVARIRKPEDHVSSARKIR